MIRVKKPNAPRSLENGRNLTRNDCKNYNTNYNDYICGRKKFQFKKNIYGHKKVRDALRNAQSDKCCFCEGHFTAFAAGDIEHYRPKGSVRQDANSKSRVPGYFWLAYSWDNLYWCCQICNRSYKKDFFPLKNPNNRARSHRDSILNEKPLILDPGGSENPRKHIDFNQERAIGKTQVGEMTIQVVGLNRPELLEERLAHLQVLKTLLAAVNISDSCRYDFLIKKEIVQQKLDEALTSTAKFSAMALDYMTGHKLKQE